MKNSTNAIKNKPLAYKCGVAWFSERPFFVNKNVLIPRFDTEVLVETVILNAPQKAKVLDLCTGSGCIAVILGLHDFIVTASDISRKALKVAKKNANLNDVKVDFMKSDLFAKINEKFDVIVSNPPYIKTEEIGAFDKTTLHEPRIALDGGGDGFNFYWRICNQAPRHLNDGGMLFVEICHKFADDIVNLFKANDFVDVSVVKDKQGLARVVYGRLRRCNIK